MHSPPPKARVAGSHPIVRGSAGFPLATEVAVLRGGRGLGGDDVEEQADGAGRDCHDTVTQVHLVFDSIIFLRISFFSSGETQNKICIFLFLFAIGRFSFFGFFEVVISGFLI